MLALVASAILIFGGIDMLDRHQSDAMNARGWQRPIVLALAGLPGSGKSTLARALQVVIRCPVLDRDQIRAECWPGDPGEAARKAADQLLLRRVGTGVRAGMSLIVDGKTYALEQDRAALAAEVNDADGQLQWLWLDVDPALACQRIALQSGHPAPDRDAALVLQVAARFAPFGDTAWRLDAVRPTDELLQQVIERLAGRPQSAFPR